MMKIILRADVDNLGHLGDQVTVKPGYARNYLIPQGLAMIASPSNIKQFETERKKLQARMDSLRAEAQSLADKLAKAQVVIEVRVGEGDRLYGSVTNTNIADTLESMGIEIDKRKIILEAPIRSLGEYDINIRLHPDVDVDLKVFVIRQGGSIEELQQKDESEAESAEETVAGAAEEAEAPQTAEEDTEV